jgi:hypothetical protein
VTSMLSWWGLYRDNRGPSFRVSAALGAMVAARSGTASVRVRSAAVAPRLRAEGGAGRISPSGDRSKALEEAGGTSVSVRSPRRTSSLGLRRLLFLGCLPALVC